jgi:hypothetical protein
MLGARLIFVRQSLYPVLPTVFTWASDISILVFLLAWLDELCFLVALELLRGVSPELMFSAAFFLFFL